MPRTRPGVPLWMHSSTQRVWTNVTLSPHDVSAHNPHLYLLQCLERILYVWAIRHPASGYVQGINDLATPFFEVFLSAYLGKSWSSYLASDKRHDRPLSDDRGERRCRSRRNRPRDPSRPRSRRRRGRFVLVPLASARRDPRKLHHRTTGHPAQREAHGGACRTHRRAALRAPRHARRRVYAVRV